MEYSDVLIKFLNVLMTQLVYVSQQLIRKPKKPKQQQRRRKGLRFSYIFIYFMTKAMFKIEGKQPDELKQVKNLVHQH